VNDTDELDRIWRDGLRRLAAPTMSVPETETVIETRVRHRHRARLALAAAGVVLVASAVVGVAERHGWSVVRPTAPTPAAPAPAPLVVDVVDAPNNALTLTLPGRVASGQPPHVDLAPGLIEFRVDLRSSGHIIELEGVSDFAAVDQAGIATRTVRLGHGVYRLFCAVPGHADAGEQMLLDVH
jgi:hypothetical protein